MKKCGFFSEKKKGNITMSQKKRWIPAALAAGMTGILLCGTPAGKLSAWAKEDDFDVTGSASIDKNNSVLTIKVSVTNDGDDFGGYVRVKVTGAHSPVGYERYVSIAENTTEDVVFKVPVVVTTDYENAQMVIEILSESGKVLETKTVRSAFSNTSFAMGILSMDPGSLSYLEGKFNRGYFDAEVVTDELSDNYLDELSTLSNYEYIVVDGYDTSSLSSLQLNNLMAWTRSGGTLILGTGEEGADVVSGFVREDPDFLKVTVANIPDDVYSYWNDGGEGTIHFDWEYDSYYYYDDGMYFDYDSIGSISGDQTSTHRELILSEFDYDRGTSSEFLRKIGNGYIFLCGESLGDQDSYYAGNLYSAISYGTVNQGSSYANSYNFTHYTAEEYYGLLQGSAKVNVAAVEILVILYVILVGPILYLILKKADRREKMWFMIPVLAFVTVILMYIIGKGFGIKKRDFRDVIVTPADGNGSSVAYVFGHSSAEKKWTINLKDEVEYIGPLVTEYEYTTSAAPLRYVTTESTKGLSFSYVPTTVFEPVFLKAFLEEQDDVGEIVSEVVYDSYTGDISGEVTNDTDVDFDWMIVVCNNSYQMFQNVEEGEKVRVRQTNMTSLTSSGVMNEASRQYYKNTAESEDIARSYAALGLAIDHLKSNQIYVIGVTKSNESLIASNVSEVSYHCYYVVQ